MPTCEPDTMPKMGDTVFVRCPGQAAKHGVSHPDMVRPAIITNVWGVEPNSLVSVVAFNDQDGPPSFMVQSIPHAYYVNLSQPERDYWMRSVDELGE